MAARILVVEDEPLISAALVGMLEQLGHTVCGAASEAGRAVEMVLALRPSLVTMDLDLEGAGHGLAAAALLHATAGLPIVFVTGTNDPDQIAQMAAVPRSSVVLKPFTPAALRRAIDGLLLGSDEPSPS